MGGSEMPWDNPHNFEFDEVDALDHEGNTLASISGDFRVWASFNDDTAKWEVDQIDAYVGYIDGKKEWRRIDDVPECMAIVRGIEALVVKKDEPEGWREERRLYQRYSYGAEPYDRW